MNDPVRDTPLLFTPIQLRSVVARNRIVSSPMCQYASDDGGPEEWQLVNFGRFAMGGCGIVFGEESAVEARGRKTHHCAGIYSDSHVPAYRRITDFIKSLGAVPAIQLGHCGRRASQHGPLKDRATLTEVDAQDNMQPWQGISPSPLPPTPGGAIPREMDASDIRATIVAWREAAQRSVDAGYDICEIHGAHGYLIHQFLSPLSNLRSDGYGGSLEGRMRYALEVVEAVRAVWPQDKPLFFRTSAVEGAGGVWGIEETLALTRELKLRGVDAVDCSSGGVGGDGPMPGVPRVPGFQAGYAREIRRDTGMPTVAVGMITDAHHAEAILRDGSADLIALARGLMDNPNWPLHAARELGYADPLSLVHAREAQRLRLLEQHSKEYPPGIAVEIPFGPEEQVSYSWAAGIAGPRSAS
jgi:2,4-dienoyl-CoA reductase-like NADH-dependent reductase (Old Yellow Enzyme family)